VLQDQIINNNNKSTLLSISASPINLKMKFRLLSYHENLLEAECCVKQVCKSEGTLLLSSDVASCSLKRLHSFWT
jgi:hypothetical protein